MRKQTYKTQIGLILTVTLIGLLLPGLAQAAALRAKAKGLSHEPTLRGISSKVDDPSGRTPSEPAQKNLIPVLKEDPPTRTVGTGTLSPAIIASRTSGTAPFAVFFEGTNSRDRNGNYIGDSTTTADPQSVGLLDNAILEYTWDFGPGTENDPGGQYFSGFNAAHVYETPGTYTVTLTIRDELGSESITIEVNAQSSDSLETYCFSNDADFTGCPASVPTQNKIGSTTNINSYIASNRRLLLKRGDSYNGQVNFGSNTNVILDAYGTCIPSSDPEELKRGICSNAPLVQGGNPSITGGTKITVKDIHVSSGSTNEGLAGTDHFLVLRVLIDYYKGNGFYADTVFFVNSILRESSTGNMYYNGNRLTLIDNEIGNCGTESNLYGSVINKGVIVGNYWHDCPAKTGLRIAANTAPGSWNVVVSDNEFEHQATSIGMAVTNSGAPYSGNNILIERNYIHDFSWGGILNDNDGYNDVIIRNNLIKSGQSVISSLYLRDEPDGGLGPLGIQGLKFYGNTIFTDSSNPVLNIETSDHTNVEIFNNIIYGTSSTGNAISIPTAGMNEITSNNNLFYFPARTNADIFWVGSGPLNIQEWQALANNPDTNSLCADDPDLFCNDYNPSFITDPPSLPEHFRLQSTSPAIDTGMSLPLVYEDYDKNRRPIDGDTSGTAEWDIGAYEYGLLTLPGDFDADGDVDMDDYAMFEEAYTGAGRPVAPGYEYADLDGDGDVDLDDFAIFAANYTG